MNTFLHNLRARATDTFVRTIIFPEAHDERVLEAANILKQEKLANPLFVTTAEDVERVTALGLDCTGIEEETASALEKFLLEVRSSKIGTKDELTPEMARALSHNPLHYALYLLRIGRADGLVAGAATTTADVVRAGLWIIGKNDGIQTVSSSMYLTAPSFRGTPSDEVLTLADCAVVPNPTSEQLADIAIATADARSIIVGDTPRVALLSYSTKGSGGDGASISTVRNALTIIRDKRPGLIIDGELQADAALIQSISNRKAPGNLIDGNANVLIFPSLDAANIAYKLVTNLVPGARALGPILQGMNRPMSDLSRGARVDDIVHIATIVASQVAHPCHPRA